MTFCVLTKGSIIVVVKAYSSGGIQVYGALNAVGTDDNPVVFTSVSDLNYGGSGIASYSSGWKGINIPSSGSFFGNNIEMRYCMYHCIRVLGSINLNNSVLFYADRGLDIQSSTYVSIKNTTIDSTLYGMFISGIINSPVVFENNKIINSTNGISLTYSGLGDLYINNNIITMNGRGIYVSSSGNGILEISNNIVTNNAIYAIDVNLTSTSGHILDNIKNNQFSGNYIDQLQIEGYLNKDTILPICASPYYIETSIIIEEGSTLDIEPGVLIFGKGQIIVNGVLSAVGTEVDPIVFTINKDPSYGGSGDITELSYWKGIRVNSSGEFNGNYVQIKYGYDLYMWGGSGTNASLYSSGKLDLNHCQILDSYRYGILLNEPKRVKIINSIVDSSQYGLHINNTNQETNIILEMNKISNSNTGLYLNHVGIGDVQINNNEFSSNVNGLYISGYKNGDISISNNLFRGSTGDSLYVYLTSMEGDLLSKISNNTFVENGINAITIGGYVDNNITLTKNASPYVLQSNMTFASEGVIVTIEPGVVLKGKASQCRLHIEGTINALGTKENPIVFTSINDDKYGGSGVSRVEDYWWGLEIKSTGTFNGEYVEIRYANYYGDCNSIVVRGKINLVNSEIFNYYGNGIHFITTIQPILVANTFRSNTTYMYPYAIINANPYNITINAEYNYWGSPYGPTGKTKVSSGVDFTPYLGEEIKIQSHFGKPGTNVATGNFSRTYTDMDMPVPGFKLNISRTYNSGDNREDSPLGPGWTFGFQGNIKSYGVDNTLKVVRLPNGGAQSFKQNSDGTFTAHDSRSNLVQQADGSYILTTPDQYSYGFGNDGYLKWMKDRNGNTITINTDNSGKILSIVDPTGHEFTISYDANNKITAVTDPMGRSVTYAYENGRLSTATDPAGKVTSYTYTSYTIGDKTKWLLTQIKDHHNTTVESVTYFADETNGGKVATTTDRYGNTLTYVYENGDRKTTITDTNGRQTTKWYDTSFNITNSKDAEEKYTATEYFTDADGNNIYGEQKSTTDRNGNKTQYERDARGNVTKIINPDNSYKLFTYDAKNNMTSERDELGKFTYYVYDSNMLKLLKKAQPLNGTDVYTAGCDESKFAITTYAYFDEGENGYTIKGLLKSVTDPEGNITTYTYDASGNTKTVSDPETLEVVTYEYNTLGWKTAEISPRGFKTEYSYDKNGNVVKVVKNASSATPNVYCTVYDDLGRKVQEISANEYESSKDGLDLVAGINMYNDPAAGTRYAYNDNGTLQSVTDAENNTTSYTYDLYGNILTETKPNGAVFVNEYDMMNRQTKKYFKDSSESTPVLLEEYQYAILADKTTTTTMTKYLNDTETAVTTITNDYAGREIKRRNPDNTEIITIYNQNGTVSSVKGVNGGTTYSRYDGLNRLTEQWAPFEQTGSLYSYKKITYDRAGRQKMIQVGRQLVGLYALPSSFSETIYDYYKNGKVKAVYQNGRLKTEYQYDNDGNVSEEKSYTSATAANVVQYTNDYQGKPLETKVIVRKGDIGGNLFSDNTYITLTTINTYDLNGNLKTVQTPNLVITTYAYDKLNRQISVSQPGIDESGNPATIITSQTYDWEGKVLSSTDPEMNVTSYVYNKRGFLEKVNYPDNGTAAFWYDRAGRKTAEVSPESYDPNKPLQQMNRVIYTFDRMDRIITKTYEGIEKVYNPTLSQWVDQSVSIVQKAYKYDNSGNVIKELDALGFEAGTGDVAGKITTGYGTITTYNLANQVKTVCDPVNAQNGLSYTISYTYDGLGQKLTETNASGAITVYEYDTDGNVVKVQVKANASSSPQTIRQATYDYLGNVLTVTDGNNNTTTYEYNALNKVRSTVYPSDATIPANTVICQYDNMGNMVFQKDSIGRIEELTYDNQGRNLTRKVRNSDSSKSITTSVRYDLNGNKRFVTDGNLTTSENRYDSMNRLTDTYVTVSGVLHHTHYTYDKNGNQTSTTDWRGNTSTLAYDALNRLIQKKDPYEKAIQKLVYNHNNVQALSYDALDNVTQYTYDRNNRLLTTIDPELHTTKQTYDNVGNIKTKVDGKNNTTTYTYDEFNRLTKVTNAKNENTSYTYDLNGNMLSQTDGKTNVQYFEYNAGNKLIRRVDAGGRTGTPGSYTYNPAKIEAYTYYADGNLQTKTDRNGKTTDYTYDIFGRLTELTVDSIKISYTYDNNGNQLTMQDSTGTTTREYDELNRVTKKTVPHIGTSIYAYDITTGMAEGCYAERTTDPKSNVVLKVYDKLGRLKEVTLGGDTTSYEYYDNGNRKSVIYGSGLREDYTYYKDNLLHTLINKKADGSTIDSYTYTYDAAHNQLSKVDGKGTGTTSYGYDVLNRLSTVSEPSGRAISYTYDASGNRLTETIIVGTQTTVNTYSYNEQNRLNGIIAKVNNIQTMNTIYTYDNNGNQLVTTINNVVQLTNTYNALNQLSRTEKGSDIIQYMYNADGYRVEKSANGTITRYLYEADKVVLEVNSTGTQEGRNVYGLNLLKRTVAGATYSYLYNGHADVTALISSSGSISATYYYDAFGNVLEQTGTVNNSITFAGYQYDKETGLYYLNSRYYDSLTSRFLSEDTYRGDKTDPLSLNKYSYCHNEPIMYWDPTGHSEATDKYIDTSTEIGQATLGIIETSGYLWTYYNNLYKEASSHGLDSLAESYLMQREQQHAIAEMARIRYYNDTQDEKYYNEKFLSIEKKMTNELEPILIASTATMLPPEFSLRDYTLMHLETQCWAALKVGGRIEVGVFGAGRADLVDFDTNEVWEVKPDKQKYYTSGPKQLKGYINASTKIPQKKFGFTPLIEGHALTPGGTVSIPFGKNKALVIRSDESKGMIYYSLRNSTEQEQEAYDAVAKTYTQIYRERQKLQEAYAVEVNPFAEISAEGAQMIVESANQSGMDGFLKAGSVMLASLLLVDDAIGAGIVDDPIAAALLKYAMDGSLYPTPAR